MISFYDTHAHLDYPEFQQDLPQVVERAKTAGIERLVTIGTDLDSSARAIALSERFAEVYAVAGWHPNDVDQAPSDLRPELRRLAAHPKVVAIGETGLDHYRLPSTRSQPGTMTDADFKLRQIEIFQQHLEVAAELGLNCVIHERDAFEDVLAVLKPYAGRVRCVFHCFVGTPDNLVRILDLDCLVSYTGIFTFKNAQTVRDILKVTPLDKLMFETDAPFLAPVPHRGRRCEPAFVKDTAMAAAEIRNCRPEDLSAATCQTARRFFAKMA